MHTLTLRDLFSAPDGELLITESELSRLSAAGVESWIEVMGDTCLDHLVRVQWDRGLTDRLPCCVSSEVAS